MREIDTKDLVMPTAALLSLATSVPPHVFLQKDVQAAAWDVFGSRFPDYDRFASIFTNTGIVKRHGVKPFEWYLEPRGWPERTEAFLEGAEALFIDVAGKALAGAGLDAADVDTVVTVCSTGIATPSLDARVHRRMGFRSDVSRVPVFGLPGNPVSTRVSFELFVRPSLRLLAGHRVLERPIMNMVLDSALPRKKDGKIHLVHVVARVHDDGVVHAERAIRHGSHLLSAVAEANALAIVPEGDGLAAGDVVRAMILDADQLSASTT